MNDTREQLTSDSAILVVRGLALERRTGVLELWRDESAEPERLYFLGGELYLEPTHPLAVDAASVQVGAERKGLSPAERLGSRDGQRGSTDSLTIRPGSLPR